MRRMTQAQYAAVVARQRQLKQNRTGTQNEVKPKDDLEKTQNNGQDNAINAIRELNEKVAEREKMDSEIQSKPPPAAVPSNFQMKQPQQPHPPQKMQSISSKNVANNIRQNINMKKNMTEDDVEAANELQSNYDKLENVKIEVVENEQVREAPPKQDVVTAAAVKNFEMIFNNTNSLLEKYKNHAAMVEKQNENISTTYERKLRSSEIIIENLTKTVNELTSVIKGLTEKISVMDTTIVTEETNAEETNIEETNTEETNAEETNAEETNAEETNVEENNTDENITDENNTDENITDENEEETPVEV